MNELDRLMQLMARLRDPQSGCPWDRRQTMRSLLPHTLEEVYELADTIERGDMEHLREELGDYLFQAAFYAQIAAEQRRFTLQQVIDGLIDKLIMRHPHVFPDGELDGVRANARDMDEASIKQTWEQLKQEVRLQRDQRGVLDDVPLALPAMQRAQKLQKRAASVGFDWPDVSGVDCKLQEEIEELRVARRTGSAADIRHELGDLLFTCVNLARHLGVDAESALGSANRRFEQRFAAMESGAVASGQSLDAMTAGELDTLWQQVKQQP